MGNSNEGCSKGGYEQNPPPVTIYKSHALDHPQKRRKSQKSQKDPKLEIFKDLNDMEINVSEEIQYWT